ncbi:MAG: hypothetical protein AAF513_06060 [Pseudomonadota bacterium]
MEHLLGTHFVLQDARYAIVDVRDIAGETMIYAEPEPHRSGDGGPKRAVFRYRDVVGLLGGSQQFH